MASLGHFTLLKFKGPVMLPLLDSICDLKVEIGGSVSSRKKKAEKDYMRTWILTYQKVQEMALKVWLLVAEIEAHDWGENHVIIYKKIS